MLTLFLWIAVGCAALSVADVLVNLFAFRDLPPEAEPRSAPLVSICVPARNEERDVEAAVRSHLAQTGLPIEVLVVDDRSTDRTGEILDRLAASEPNLRVLRPGEPPPGWMGKSAALAAAVRESSGEWLLFVDADVRLAPSAVAAGLREAERTGADLLALLPRFELATLGERIVLPFLGDAFYWFPTFLAHLPRFRKISVGGGAYMLVRRAAYDAFGGHAAIHDRVIDDVGLALHAKASGARTRIALGTRLVEVRMYRGLGEIFRGFSKNLYVALSRSPFRLLLATLLVLVELVLPVSVLAAVAAGAAVGPLPLRLAGAGAVGFLVARVAVDLRLRRNPLFAVTYPLMGLCLVGMFWYSAARWHLAGGVEWRGRRYAA